MTFDASGTSLFLCGTIVSIFNCSTRSHLTKVLLSFMVEALVVFAKVRYNIYLFFTPYLSSRYNAIGCTLTEKLVFNAMNEVTSNPLPLFLSVLLSTLHTL